MSRRRTSEIGRRGKELVCLLLLESRKFMKRKRKDVKLESKPLLDIVGVADRMLLRYLVGDVAFVSGHRQSFIWYFIRKMVRLIAVLTLPFWHYRTPMNGFCFVDICVISEFTSV